MYRILIVEDDETIAAAIAGHITTWGWEAVRVADFHDVLGEFVRCDPQLVLMDITLPFYNGYYWCAELRKVSKVPVLFISSASDDLNIVMAVNMGGDDFLAKPFDLSVLSAKIRALLRRAYDFAGASPLLEHAGAVLNTADGIMTYQGRQASLTRNEHRILQLLLENKGAVVSRDAMMTRLWESDSYVDENTLTVNVTRLRRKLAELGLTDLIRTKKGAGYLVD